MPDDFVTRNEFEQRLISLKELFVLARDADKEAVALALSAAKEAVTKAEAADEKRFELLNEFRGQQADTVANFLQRNVYETQHSALEKIVQVNAERVSILEGRILGLFGAITILSVSLAAWATLAK